MIWIFVFFLVLALAYKPQDKRLFTLVFIILYLLVALRNHELGMYDTQTVYLPFFNRMIGQSLDWVIETHKDKDLFFYVCTHFFQYLSKDEQLYLAVCALPFFIPNYLLIKRYSSNYAISIALFMAVNFYYVAFTGIRHCIALGLVTMAYISYIEKQNYKVLLYSFLAACFHISAYSFFIVFIVRLYKYRMKYFYSALAMAVLGAVFFVKYLRTSLIGNVLQAFSRFELYDQYYMQEESLNFNFGIIVTILTFISLHYYNKKQTFNLSNTDINVDCWMMTIGMICSFLVVIMGEFMRITSFFIIPLMIHIPYALKNNKYYGIMFMIMAYVYFYISPAVHSNILDYKFFFE